VLFNHLTNKLTKEQLLKLSLITSKRI